MQQNEKFKDWLFRYQSFYRVRRTDKSKRRFLSALVADISDMREDVQVIEYNRHKKYASRNVYVGDIEKADRIICTYYDTPIQHFGPYVLFDREAQEKRTTSFIIVSSVLLILLGIAGTFFYMQNASGAVDLLSVRTLFIALAYGVFFYLLGKIAKGSANRKTLIRNTSSVLAMLAMISEAKGEKTAFAFVDEGSFGESGLEAMRTPGNKKAKIFFLDCVGADAPLHVIGNDVSKAKLSEFSIDHRSSDEKITYIFSAKTSENEQKTQFYLDKADLDQKNLNMENITKVVELCR